MRGHAPRSEGSKVAVISLHNGIHFRICMPWLIIDSKTLYCIKIDICILCSIVDQADCNSGPTFLCILVDLLLDLSSSGGGGRGGLQNPENPPWLYGLVLKVFWGYSYMCAHCLQFLLLQPRITLANLIRAR